MQNRQISLFYLMELISGLARGSYLSCIGWSTLVISDSVAKVGQIFIVQALTIMLAGPVIGVIIDRYKRKTLIVSAQCLIATIMFAIGGFLLYTPKPSVWWLFLAVFIITLSRLTYRGSFDCIVKEFASDEKIMRTVARGHSLHLVTVAAGMAGIGFVIDKLSPGYGFVISASTTILVLLTALFLKDGFVKTNTPGLAGYLVDFKNGFEVFRRNQLMRMLAILAAIALPVGQLVNATLPSFIRDDLGLGSDVYGLVDAGWAIGGMLAAGILSNKIKAVANPYAEYIMAILAGLSTIALSYCTAVWSLTLSHALMGFFVWSCRILITGRVIELCSPENVGRTRVYIEVLLALSAVLMCLSPTLIVLGQTASYLFYWGILIVAGALLLMVRRKFQIVGI